MFRRFSILSLFSIGFLWTAHTKLYANELIDSSTFTGGSRNSSLNSLSLLQERITAQFITKYLQDSNLFLTDSERERKADILSSSVRFGIKGGGEVTGPGLSYHALYQGDYLSTLTDGFEYYSPEDHKLLTFIELRGAFTKIRLNANLEENGGYARSESFDGGISSSVAESRGLGSKRKNIALGVSRQLSSSVLEIGFSIDDVDYQLVDIFSGSSVNYSRDRLAADLSWFVEPTFLSKTRLGLGLTAGKDDVAQNLLGAQSFLAPTLRAKWNFSPKTAFAGWIGFDERWRDSDDFSETTSVYGLKGFWTAPTDTKLSVDITKKVLPSIFERDDNVATKKLSIGASQDFNRGFNVGLRFFYEFSDYKPTNSGSLRGRTEDLKSFRVSLGKSMQINYFKESQVSIFYNHFTNDSTKEYYDFERDQFGLEFKFSL